MSEDGKVNGYTPTQRRLLEVLADGRPHARHELVAVLRDDMSCSLSMHLTLLRRKLRLEGRTVVTENGNARMVAYFNS